MLYLNSYKNNSIKITVTAGRPVRDSNDFVSTLLFRVHDSKIQSATGEI